MSNITIIYDIASDTGGLVGSGDGWAPGLPVSNLRTDDLAAVARYLDITEGPAVVTATFDRLRPVSAWALIGHNCSMAATMQVGVKDETGAQLYLSSLQQVWEPTVIWGSLPWGAWPWEGVDPDTFPGAPIAFHLAPEAVYGLSASLQVNDAVSEAGYFQAGRLIVGEGWTPPDVENHDYGSSIQVIDPAPVSRTRGGRRLVGDAERYRRWEIRLSYQSQATAIGVYHDLMWRLGKRGDFLVIWDPDEEPAMRNRLMLYGALADTSPITIVENDAWDVVLQIEELV